MPSTHPLKPLVHLKNAHIISEQPDTYTIRISYMLFGNVKEGKTMSITVPKEVIRPDSLHAKETIWMDLSFLNKKETEMSDSLDEESPANRPHIVEILYHG